MALVTGDITQHGAIVGVFVGVSQSYAAQLRVRNHPVPPPLGVRAEVDTGSFYTIFQTATLRALGLEPVRRVLVATPSTQPGQPAEADQYHVDVDLISGMTTTRLPGVLVLAADSFGEHDPAQGVIGRDILKRCVFTYDGPADRFQLAF